MLGGLVALFEADQNVSTTANNVVDGWLDGSGNGMDLTGFGDPTYLENATPTGQSAIAFDGNGDKLERSGSGNLSFLPEGDEARTVFFVADYQAMNRYVGVSYGDAAQNEAFGLTLNGIGGKMTLQGYGATHDVVTAVDGFGNNDGSAGDDWMVHSVVYQGGASDAYAMYKNGVNIASGTRNFATDVKKLVIGEEIGKAGFGTLEVSALLIYDRALSASERQEVEAYLSEKYVTPPASAATFALGNPVHSFDDVADDTLGLSGIDNDNYGNDGSLFA